MDAARSAGAGVERTACITDDGIVLRVSENDRVLWEATSLQRGEQDAALFGVPPGYQLIDPQAVASKSAKTWSNSTASPAPRRAASATAPAAPDASAAKREADNKQSPADRSAGLF